MFSSRRIVTLVATLGAVLFAPTTATATTFCVNDAACVGTASVSIDAAVTAANANPGPDTVQIGAQAAPYVLAGALTSSAAQQITIIGAGSALTRIQQPVGVTALTVAGISPTVRGLGFVTTAGGSSSNYGLNVFSNSGSINVEDIAVTGAGLGGLGLGGQGIVRDVQVTLPIATIDAVMNPGVYSIGVNTGASNAQILRLEDVQVQADLGLSNVSNGGTLELNRASIVGTMWGINHRGNNTTNGSTSLRTSSTLVRMTTAHPSVTVTTALEVSTNATTQDTTSSATLYDVTLIGASNPGAGVTSEIGLRTSTFENNGFNGVANGAIDGAVIWGFQRGIAMSTGGGTTASVNIDRVIYDPTGNQIGAPGVLNTGTGVSNVDPQFVDAASFDFRSRWGSPMIDTGTTALSSWESTTDLDGLARPVWATGGVGAPKLDIGAYEYHKLAPVVGIGADRAVAPGASVTLTALATDANSGEGATLQYAWTAPGGATSSTGIITFTAPTAPGTYQVTVVATDVSGATGTDSLTLTVSAPPTGADPTTTGRRAVVVLARAFSSRRIQTCGAAQRTACVVSRAVPVRTPTPFAIRVSVTPLAAAPPRRASVVAQRWNGRRWVTALPTATVSLDAKRVGTWSLPRSLRSTSGGKLRIRVTTAQTATAKLGTSAWRYLRIS
jgi:hypothetical protein